MSFDVPPPTEYQKDRAAARVREGRCGSCAHWLRPEDNQWVETYQPNACHHRLGGGQDITRRDGRWGLCLLTVYGRNVSYAYSHPDSLALAHDHEDYGAELLTRPDFGCVQWEKKETE
jgi:hypothetical protein